LTRVIAITGAAGYLAQHLIQHLANHLPECDLLVGFDLKKNVQKVDFPFEYYSMDILDLSSEILREHGVTDLIHMAWMVTPTHNRQRAYNIDIHGTEHVLNQALRAGAEYFLHTSSTLAYGAYVNNPNPLTESHPLRGNKDFHYSHHKMLAERLLDDFEEKNAGTLKIGRIRPSPILSPDLNSFVTTILQGGWRTFYLMPHPDSNTPIQFLHIDDAIQAFFLMVSNRLEGAYNANPSQSIVVGEIPRILSGRGIRIPLRVLKLLLWFQWNLRLSEVPPPYLDFVAYPYVASNAKLQKEGFNPKFTTEETLKFLRS
jgi:UDP-glucose 4-epimerase